MREAVDHPGLGRLTWDASQQIWQGQVELRPGLRVIVSVDARGDELDTVLAGAARGVGWLRGHEEYARLCVADAYLDTFNQTWSEEGPITRDEFARRIELVEVSFGTTGGTSLWYDDGDLFAGHSIHATFDADGRFVAASLFG